MSWRIEGLESWPFRALAAALFAGGLAAAPARSQVLPLAPDFPVNSLEQGYESTPLLVPRPQGGFVVVWHGTTALGTRGISARAFTGPGDPIGDDVVLVAEGFNLNGVGSDSDGDFVVTWDNSHSSPSGGYGDAVRARRFWSDLSPRGSAFVVNSDEIDWYGRGPSSVAVHTDGHFQVAWGNGEGWFQRYAADGEALGDNVVLDEGFLLGAIAPRAGGGFVVAGHGYPPCCERLVARAFYVGGQPVGPEFLVAPLSSTYGVDVALERSPSGFVVVWADGESYETDVYARRLDAAGQPLGAVERVNAWTAGRQSRPQVDVDAAGRVVVAWQSEGSPGSDQELTSIQARCFAEDGTPIGGQFQVNTTTPSAQDSPDVVIDPFGRLVVVWQSWNPGATADLRARRFVLPFFADGFENGTRSRWSG